MVPVLHSYQNGNTNVTLYADGSKERTCEGMPQPLHPESIDVKITNYCDAGCSYCHEQSTTAGRHADLRILGDTLAVLPAGVELALGGGNPLSHPDLVPFLVRLKNQGIVTNITVNQKHLEPYRDLLLRLIRDEMVRGVGISYSSIAYLPHIRPILDASSNVVFHVIMGVNRVSDINTLRVFCGSQTCRVLVLGYKKYGFGLNYYERNQQIDQNQYAWYTRLATYFRASNLVLSFDNLAIQQLRLQRYFTSEAWERFFMGDDFVFTMYVDGVEQTMAASSTSPNRCSFEKLSLLDYFQKNRNTGTTT